MKSFVKFRSKQSRRRQARLISPWCSALERLESRALLAATIVAPGVQTTLEDTAKGVSGLLFTSSIDSVTVTLSVTNGTLTVNDTVSGGVIAAEITGNGTSLVSITANVVTVNTTLANATGLTYLPRFDFNGSDTLAIIINNLTDIKNATAALTITPVADIVADSLTTNEDTAVTANVITGTNGASIDTFEGMAVLTSVTQGANGAVTFTSGGNVTYTPKPNFIGSDNFTYTVTSGGVTETATVSVTVTNVDNDAPAIAAPAVLTTTEDSAKVISGLSFADPDSGSSNVTVTLSVGRGKLTLPGNIANGLLSSQIIGNGTLMVTISAPLAALNTTLANTSGLTYTPDLNINGGDTLTISINDNGNTGTGGNKSASASVAITVTAINDAPSISLNLAAAELTVAEDAGLTTTAAAFVTVTSFGDANESTQIITEYTVTQVSPTGSLTFLTAPSIDPVTRKLTYKAAASSSGTATFSVTATDNGGTANSGSDTSDAETFVITVTAVNDAPTISAPAAQTASEDIPLVISGLSFADVDAGSGNVTVVLVVLEGRLTLSENVTNGLNSAQITANGSASVTIMAPLAAINATLLNASGLTYKPALNYNGSDGLGISINDNGNTGSGVAMLAGAGVSIAVTAVNDAPSFMLAGNPLSVSEDSPGLQVVAGFASGISVGPTVDETSSQTISNFTVTAGPTTGGLTFLTAPSIDPNTGTLIYQAAANANGTATFTVTLTDSGSNTSPNVNTSASKSFVITVTAVNDAPTIATPATQTTPQGTAKFITGLSFADVDAGTSNVTVTLSAPGGKLTVLGNVTSGVTTSQVFQTTVGGIQTTTITAPLAAINATLANAAGLTYTPNALFFGNDSLSITINDLGNTGGAAVLPLPTASVAIFVTPSGGYAIITAETKNVTYTAPGSAKLRATVVNGVLIVSVNGIGYPFYQQTDKIETLTFTGGSRNDEVNLTGLSPVLYSKLTKVVIKGGAGNDSLIGSDIVLTIPVTQTINGDAGNDTLSGGVGDDSLNGGAGTDLLIQSGDLNLTLTNTSLTGELGTDRLTGVENASLTGGAGGNMFDASAFTLGSVTLIGGDGQDQLLGGSKNDAISGQDGDDVLVGGAGNDTISGGEGDDMLRGGTGNDLLIGGFGIDMINGDDGNDTALGGQGGSARNGNSARDDDGPGMVDMVVAEHINEAFKKLFAFE